MEVFASLTHSQSRAVRQMLATVRRAERSTPGTHTRATSYEDRRDLRSAVVAALLAGKRAHEIIVERAPKVQRRNCPRCKMATIFRNGSCERHKMEQCSVCQAMTIHVDGNCTEHEQSYCSSCGGLFPHRAGKCLNMSHGRSRSSSLAVSWGGW